MTCRFVLVRTSHPGNIGAVARAMKTMDIDELYLVNPKRFPDEEAIARATHGTDILASAVVCQRLEDALSGTIAVYGLSARTRELSVEPMSIREAAIHSVEKEGSDGKVAFVFGNESTGLTNEELSLCQYFAQIPTSEYCASLNLGSAAQVVAYERLMAQPSDLKRSKTAQTNKEPLATFDDYEGFYDHLEKSLGQTQFLEAGNSDRIMRRLRRLFDRSALEKKEIMILRGILTAFQRQMDKK